jgi:hypothetical protein
MMAGIVYLIVGPMNFFMGFGASELIAWLSKLSAKEGLRMFKKVVDEVTAFARRQKGRIIASWEAHLPSRDSLLMSL